MPERSRQPKRATQGPPAGGAKPPGRAVVLEHGTLGARVARLAIAEVFEATHGPTGAPRLVYVLRAAATKDQPLIHRAVCEADAAGWLRNPAGAKLVGHGTTPGGRMYVAVDRPAGRTLADVVAESGPLAPPRVVRMACHLVEVLAEAHAVGLVHGHLTPRAVLVAADPDAPGGARVALTGLGLTWLAVASDVHPEDGAFLSPERLAGAEPDVRSDVYGLAALLRHALGDAAGAGPVGDVLAIARSPEPRRRHPGVRELWEELLAALVSGTEPQPEAVRRPEPPPVETPAPDLEAIALELEILPIPPPPRAMSADVAADGWVAVPSAPPTPWLGADLWAPVAPADEGPAGWRRPRGPAAGDERTPPRSGPRRAAPPVRAQRRGPARRSLTRLVLWLALPAAAAFAWSRVMSAPAAPAPIAEAEALSGELETPASAPQAPPH